MHAQWGLGVNTGNWTGMGSMYLNPANIADSKTDFCIDITSVNVGVDNNLGTLNLKSAIDKFVSGNSANINNVFNFSNNNQFSLLAPFADIHGPSVMFNSKHKYFFAISTRLRGFNQFNNFNQSLYKLINDSSTATKGDINLNSPNFNWTASLWTETAVSYGMVVLNKGKNKLKIGVTAKFLGGVGYIGVKGNNLNVSYKNGSDSFFATNTNLTYASSFINAQNAVTNGVFSNNPLSNFIGAKTGEGFGADLGVVYEYSPDTAVSTYEMDGKKGIIDYSKNKYKLRLSASVTDLGYLTYPSNLNSNIVVSGSGYLTGAELIQNVKNYTTFKNYVLTKGFYVDTESRSTKLYLPTALILSADYQLYKDFYVNATDITNLANIRNFGNAYYNTFAVTPRWDTRKVSVGLPISYSSLAGNMRVGIGVRVGGFFVGSDDMLVFFSNNQYGMNFYFGGFIPFNYKQPKDRDHDHISDKKDKCPNLAGLFELNGCPEYDRDHDGVPDSVDNCPDVPGNKSANGCPDKDGDGVEDDMDRCPNLPGPVALQGCPDRDNDGIPDIDDECPDVPGDAKLKGCPDSDGDGVPDYKDECPNQPGPASTKGCPDTDGDGVPDKIDLCPTIPGPAKNHGCPEKTPDKPEITNRTLVSEMMMNTQKEKFDFSYTDYNELNGIADQLKQHPDYILVIEAHTDNKGKPEDNQKLTQDQADKVKVYFLHKGIKENRILSTGYGDTQPVEKNTTAPGRAKNNRVVVKLMQ